MTSSIHIECQNNDDTFNPAEKGVLELGTSYFIVKFLINETLKHGLYFVIGSRDAIVAIGTDQSGKRLSYGAKRAHSSIRQRRMTHPYRLLGAHKAFIGLLLLEYDMIPKSCKDVFVIRGRRDWFYPFRAPNLRTVGSAICVCQTLRASFTGSYQRSVWAGWARVTNSWLRRAIGWCLERIAKQLVSTLRWVGVHSKSREECPTSGCCCSRIREELPSRRWIK